MSLYLISPPQFELESFAEELDAALSSGLVRYFQLRLKDKAPLDTPQSDGAYESSRAHLVEGAVVREAAEVLMPICKKHSVPFILNDSVELAKELGADGVHLGEEDGSIRQAREELGTDAIIGASCYGELGKARVAAKQGADYVAFGAFYPTVTKVPKSVPWPSIITAWKKESSVPVVAIGGIAPKNAEPLIKAGADCLAVITSVWQHPGGASAAMEEWKELL